VGGISQAQGAPSRGGTERSTKGNNAKVLGNWAVKNYTMRQGRTKSAKLLGLWKNMLPEGSNIVVADTADAKSWCNSGHSG